MPALEDALSVVRNLLACPDAAAAAVLHDATHTLAPVLHELDTWATRTLADPRALSDSQVPLLPSTPLTPALSCRANAGTRPTRLNKPARLFLASGRCVRAERACLDALLVGLPRRALGFGTSPAATTQRHSTQSCVRRHSPQGSSPTLRPNPARNAAAGGAFGHGAGAGDTGVAQAAADGDAAAGGHRELPGPLPGPVN